MPPHGNDSPLQVVPAPSPEPPSGSGNPASVPGEAGLPSQLSVPMLDESDTRSFPLLEMEVDSPRKALNPRMDTPAESRSARSEKSKSVSFDSLHIREYNIVLGDHECCSEGPPLSLGWNYTPNPTVPLDDYEKSRAPRRTRKELRQGGDTRRDILLSHAISDTPNSSPDDIKKNVKRAERKLNRQRMNRKANALFFQPIHTGPATHSE